jgi:hypothetical protein
MKGNKQNQFSEPKRSFTDKDGSHTTNISSCPVDWLKQGNTLSLVHVLTYLELFLGIVTGFSRKFV